MDWPDVHGPARAALYALTGAREPGLARQLHDQGWQGSTLRPAAISPPVFAGGVHRQAVCTTSGAGSAWSGSPVPRIAAAPGLLDALYEWGPGLNTVQGFGWVK